MQNVRLSLPTAILLAAMLGGRTAADDKAPMKIHIIAAGEYNPVETLTELKKHLEEKYRVECTTSFGGPASNTKLDNLDSLKSADLMILFARRMNLRQEQMAIIRQHWEKGKPIVGIRTAQHAFQMADNEIIDRKVLGGHYNGGGPTTNGAFQAVPADGAADHPVLKGVEPFRASRYSYGQGKLAETTTLLQICDSPKNGKLPVTWVNTYNGGRMFYTSMGAPDDFKNDNFRRLIVNAIFWTARCDPDKMKR